VDKDKLYRLEQLYMANDLDVLKCNLLDFVVKYGNWDELVTEKTL